MTPTRFLSFRKEVQDSIVNLFFNHYKITFDEMESILQNVNPVLLITLPKEAATSAEMLDSEEQKQFLSQLNTLKSNSYEKAI